MRSLFNSLYDLTRRIWHIVKGPLQVFTVFLRAVWLLFPAVFFFLAAFVAFWKLSQGRDVLISTLERTWVGGVVLLAILFWALVNWYSSRILVYRRNQLYADNSTIAYHMPRLLGYLSFTIVWIGLMRLPKLEHPQFNASQKTWVVWLLFIVSCLLYWLGTKFFESYKNKKLSVVRDLNEDSEAVLLEKEEREKSNFKQAYIKIGLYALVIIIVNTISSFHFLFDAKAWILFVSVILMQFCFLFVVVVRRGRLPVVDPSKTHFEMPLEFASIDAWQKSEKEKGNVFEINLWERILYNANIPQKEKWFFRAYNYICAASIIIYFADILSYRWSVMLGSFPTVLLSFGVLTGIFCVITFFSVVRRVNFHVVLLVLILLTGKFFPEPHNVTLINAKQDSVFNNRFGLREYFAEWVRQRKDSIAKGEYPIYFTLADGGASRSGYWTAATLGKLEDTTGGKFSSHLFCMAGASGGSVGNGTFLALLKLKDSIINRKTSYTIEANKYLKSDFLSYTLARMLGPDFVRPIFGSLPIADRAAALEYALENGEDKSAVLYEQFKRPFSDFIPTTTNMLPIICIDVTRVQDGNPSVVSNIKIDSVIFGQRVDVLSKLPAGKDMKLSTAVILGARFPYISPAGRIGKSYYVDGGYFDNSGAGVVQEMIQALQHIIRDSLAKDTNSYLKNLSFYVLHSQNGSPGADLKKIQPIMNDIAAPILTLVGAFGTQTSVNDWRLRQYMKEIHRNSGDSGYYPMNLYTNADSDIEFPMNWAISNYYIKKMDEQLGKDGDVKAVINMLKKKLK